ncbi:MAG TPA: hypothetical protein VLU47_07880, partial [Blastocatellia bacterium]|nr:hypothetical protein [Blastocatellia bacterium]
QSSDSRIGRGLPERKGAFADVPPRQQWFNSERDGVRFNTDELRNRSFSSCERPCEHAVKRTPLSSQ